MEEKYFDQENVEIVQCTLKGFNSGHAYPMQESEKLYGLF